MERVFVDTSAWVAFANKDDPDHDRVRGELRARRGRLLTSNFVFDETVTWCAARLGHRLACTVGRRLLESPRVDLVRVAADDERQAWDLFVSREDKQYSFTDCTSFVLMRRMGLGQALEVDEDFRREGFETLPAPRAPR